MNRKTWAAHIDQSLRRSANYLFKEENRCAIYRKIWTAPIDLFLHLTTIKMKVYNDAGRLDDSESMRD
jgi:hypothetical protein